MKILVIDSAYYYICDNIDNTGFVQGLTQLDGIMSA